MAPSPSPSLQGWQRPPPACWALCFHLHPLCQAAQVEEVSTGSDSPVLQGSQPDCSHADHTLYNTLTSGDIVALNNLMQGVIKCVVAVPPVLTTTSTAAAAAALKARAAPAAAGVAAVVAAARTAGWWQKQLLLAWEIG